MSIHGVLGESTSYPKQYAPEVLFAIERQLGRDEIFQATGVDGAQLATGVDVWQAFELSWLNAQGISKVAMARIRIPANSRYIVESKSLKLYFNSLNLSYFDSIEELKATIERDLLMCIGAEVSVQLATMNAQNFAIETPFGECIDDVLDGADVSLAVVDEIDDSYLANMPIGVRSQYQFHTNLLRSNCPVTNQPDWGTLSVTISTDRVLNYQNILAYVLSFRQHNGFHEQCVERIFADFLRYFSPTQMQVQANYTRRGGIDINPVRVLNMPIPDAMQRLVRQ